VCPPPERERERDATHMGAFSAALNTVASEASLQGGVAGKKEAEG